MAFGLPLQQSNVNQPYLSWRHFTG